MRGACAGGGGARGRRSGHRGMSCAGPGSVRDARSPVCRTRTFGVPDTHIPAPHRARFRRGAAGRTAYRVTRLEQQQRAVRPEQHAQGNTPRGLRAAGRAAGGFVRGEPLALCASRRARPSAARGPGRGGERGEPHQACLAPPPPPYCCPYPCPYCTGGGRRTRPVLPAGRNPRRKSADEIAGAYFSACRAAAAGLRMSARAADQSATEDAKE